MDATTMKYRLVPFHREKGIISGFEGISENETSIFLNDNAGNELEKILLRKIMGNENGKESMVKGSISCKMISFYPLEVSVRINENWFYKNGITEQLMKEILIRESLQEVITVFIGRDKENQYAIAVPAEQETSLQDRGKGLKILKAFTLAGLIAPVVIAVVLIVYSVNWVRTANKEIREFIEFADEQQNEMLKQYNDGLKKTDAFYNSLMKDLDIAEKVGNFILPDSL